MSAPGIHILTEGKAVPQFHQRGMKSQTQASVFSYNKLDPGRREIRLCILDPGAIDDPLTCALRTVSLMEHPVYETLSYAWGDPILNNEIFANGRVIEITKSLHTALRYLRKSDEPRVIWADGICINQSDLDERSFQVGMMGDIYQKGKELQIWLGEAEEITSNTGHSTKPMNYWLFQIGNDVEIFTKFLQSQKLMKTLPPIASMENPSLQPNISSAIRILELLATGCHLYQMPFFKVTGPETIEPCPTWAASLRVLSIILSRPWWTRVWIVQEVVLSTQATVHIGGYRLSLSLILDAIAGLEKHAFGCCDPWKFLWSGSHDIILSLANSCEIINGLADLIKSFQAYELTFVDALSISAVREASDPRDHVYALQGVWKQNFAFMKPSYQISTQEVYSSATKKLFQSIGLDMLDYARGIQSSNAHRLASWVCDWSRELPRSGVTPHMFNASNSREFRTEQTADRILTVEVCRVDVVCTTGITIGQDRRLGKKLKCLEAWWSLAEIEKSNEKSNIWTTILGGSFDEGAEDQRRILPEDLVAVEAWWNLAASLVEQGDYNAQIPIEDQKMWAIDKHISYLVAHSRFWLTSQGFLGLGRQTLEKGDEVFIVKGSRVPLIFRPIEATLLPTFGLSKREQGYLFVSECYLHGFMDGEAVKPDTKWQRVHLC